MKFIVVLAFICACAISASAVPYYGGYGAAYAPAYAPAYAGYPVYSK